MSIGAAGWRWLANRKYLPPAGNASMTECKTEEEARAAADAVLATWADFEDAPPPDALTQARALLRRARLCLGGHPKDGNAASSAHDVQMVDEIDTFLAEDGAAAGTAPEVVAGFDEKWLVLQRSWP